jgi:alkanesulfonate monooxygenase SsuD/methylene tetrahydromethanopterin reductase-like flavin-dependent oxidoreductase (luciferase family)
MIVDIQLNPAVEPWPRLIEGVRAAEAAGFDTAWVFDHFDGRLLRGTSMLECFTLLGAYAAATTRIGVGSMVVNMANRNPGVMALAAASVQHISGGRLRLGVGAGPAPGTMWSAEHRTLGIDLGSTLTERHARFEAGLDALDRAWVPAHGDDAPAFPQPVPRPPVYVGVNSAPLARLAGRRCDGVNVRGNHDDLEMLLDSARLARAASDRATEPFTMSVWTAWDEALADPDHPRRRYWASIGVNRLVMTCLDPFDLDALTRFLG